jgi:hypothetical protein
MHALREVLQRWGRLDKARIDDLVASHLGVPVAGLRKPLYRDLKELVDVGEAIAHYFAPSGQQIDDYDPEIHANTKAEWVLVGSEHRVLGQAALTLAGGALYPFSRLVREIRVDSGSPAFEAQTIHVFFGLHSTFFCLKVSISSLPVSFIISRTPSPFDGKPPIKELEQEFGKRAALVQVPVPGVSSVKPGERAGHVVLTFSEEKTVKITDLGSRNGTRSHAISLYDAEILRKSGDLLGKETSTAEWIAAAKGLRSWNVSKPKQMTSLALPTLVQLSKDFQLLIV